MSLRVALVVEQLRRAVPGGVGRVAEALLGALGALGALAGPGPGGSPGALDLTLVASRPPERSGPDPLGRWGFPVHSAGLPGPLLVRAWDHGLCPLRGRFDVLHGVSLAVPPRGASRALVVTVHDLAWRRHPEATTSRGRRWHEAALGRALERADALVVPSRRVAEELAAGPGPCPPITVVTWGTDHLPPPDRAGADRLLARYGVVGPFLLSVGTLEPRKNLARLAGAYARARERLPEPWPLLVVGPRGWGPGSLPAAEGIVLTGPVEDAVLAALYEQARAFAYVPLAEGYGFPPVEAMAAGTPVLASSEVPSVTESPAGEGPAALVVDPGSVEEIAEGIVRAATDESLRGRLVTRGKALAAARTWESAALRHHELWRELE